MWIGLLTGVAVQSVLSTIYVFKFDWPLQAKKAQDRVGSTEGTKPEQNVTQSRTDSECKDMSAVSVAEIFPEDTRQLFSSECSPKDIDVEIDCRGRAGNGRVRNFRRVLWQRVSLLIGSLIVLSACGVTSNFHPNAVDVNCVILNSTNSSSMAMNSSCITSSHVNLTSA
eukprot:m.66286 g.66286  ORF g.66286 m.66286 type:complete len:169 (+) comp35378_c0_seq1:939-1445(+)